MLRTIDSIPDFPFSTRSSTLPAMFAADSATDAMLLHAETKSMLLSWWMSFPIASEKFSSIDGAGGMQMKRGRHEICWSLISSRGKFSSILESPVTPLDVTVARSPFATRRRRFSSASMSSPLRIFFAENDMRMYIFDASRPEASSYSEPMNDISRTSPTLTPRRLTSLPTESPVTGLS